MQLVRSSAGVGDTNAEAIYYLAIASAQAARPLLRLLRPPPRLHRGAVRGGGRGVEVRIVVPGPHIDKGFVRAAGRAAYEPLLEGGVRIFEYQPTMLHAKTLAVDGRWATVGTMNFDNRSFQLHDEVTLGVWSERLLRQRCARPSRPTSSAARRSTQTAGAGARCG